MNKFISARLLVCSLLILSCGVTSFTAPKLRKRKPPKFQEDVSQQESAQNEEQLNQQDINIDLQQENEQQEINAGDEIQQADQVDIVVPSTMQKLKQKIKNVPAKTKEAAVSFYNYSRDHKKEVACGALILGVTGYSIYKRKAIIKFMKKNPTISKALISSALVSLGGVLLYKNKDKVCSTAKNLFNNSKQFVSNHKLAVFVSSVVLFVVGFVVYDIIKNDSEILEKITPDFLYNRIVSSQG
jgi:hypothetical protein